jgi:hypothetical protein
MRLDMPAVVEAVALPEFKVRLKFSDGVQGTVDLSALAGRGVFSFWTEGDRFYGVTIGSAGELKWGDDVDLCPDQLYLEVTGKEPEDLFPALKHRSAHA